MKNKIVTLAKFITPPASLMIGITALRIYKYGKNVADVKADAAIVLGAAVWRRDPSPVFRERIKSCSSIDNQQSKSPPAYRGVVLTSCHRTPIAGTRSSAASQTASVLNWR